MPILRALYVIIAAAAALWAITLSTLLYADVSAYAPTRAVIQDTRLDPYEAPATQGPTGYQLPDDPLYSGSSVTLLDTRQDVRGSLVIWTDDESGIIERLAYQIEACRPIEPDDLWGGTRACYAIADSAEAIDWTHDGRQYTLRSAQGQEYIIHWVRRETDPSAFDPSAIFQLTLQQPDRAVTLLLFYRLAGAEPGGAP